MELSLFLAKVWGILFVIIGIGFMLAPKSGKQIIKMVDDENFMMLSGFMALLIGIPLIVAHNIWTFDWRGLITIFAWLAVAKGIIRLFFPKAAKYFIKMYDKNNMVSVMSVVSLIIGLYLLYIGYIIGL